MGRFGAGTGARKREVFAGAGPGCPPAARGAAQEEGTTGKSRRPSQAPVIERLYAYLHPQHSYTNNCDDTSNVNDDNDIHHSNVMMSVGGLMMSMLIALN